MCKSPFRRLTLFVYGIAFLLLSGLAYSQPRPVLLLNPSFEDEPWHSKPPRGWHFCGAPGESPPDVHPSGVFTIDYEAADGYTYVGMVVRDNRTWEALGQHLQQPLEAGSCYLFSLQAMRSSHYRSISRMTGQRAEYTDPVRIRLWGGGRHCDHAELLASSEPVTDTAWTTLTLRLQPQQTHQYLIIEAFYATDTVSVARGNVLIDNCSPLLPVDCSSGEPLVDCPEISFDPPRDRRELGALIGRAAPDIAFADGTAELRNRYYCDPGGNTVQENPGLHQIATALREFPDAELVVSVKGPGKALVEQRIVMLEQRLFRLGLTPYQYKIQPYRRRDDRHEWLGVNRDGDLFITVRF